MTPYRLERDAESLQSLAADAQLLAEGAARGHSTDAFTSAHAAEVGAEAGDLASVVRSTTPPPDLRSQTAELARLAARLTLELERFEHQPGQRAVAARLAEEFGAIAKRGEELAAGA
jgi:Ser/Thr protein kinase RdoA (MazF antagonist)